MGGLVETALGALDPARNAVERRRRLLGCLAVPALTLGARGGDELFDVPWLATCASREPVADGVDVGVELGGSPESFSAAFRDQSGDPLVEGHAGLPGSFARDLSSLAVKPVEAQMLVACHRSHSGSVAEGAGAPACPKPDPDGMGASPGESDRLRLLAVG